MPSVAANGVEIAYGEAGSGNPVFLIHPEIIAPAFDPLLSQPGLSESHRLVRYDRRGYGSSSRPLGIGSIKVQAEDAIGLMRALGVEKAHLVGHSLGGSIALQVALQAPDMVASLALLEPMVPLALANADSADHLLDIIDAAFSLYIEGDRGAGVDLWARGTFGHRWESMLAPVLPEAVKGARRDASAAFELDAVALQTWDFASEEAALISQPVLSLFHRDAEWRGFEETHAWLLGSLPNARGLELSCRSHLLQAIEPGLLASELSAFWSLHPPR